MSEEHCTRNRNKAVEKGVLEHYIKQDFNLIFSGDPIWLLGLHPRFASNLYFPQFNSLDELICAISEETRDLYAVILKGLDESIFRFKTSGGSCTLLNGSLKYLSANMKGSGLMVGAIDHHYRGSCVKYNFTSCVQVSHVRVGSCTNFKGCFVAQNLELRPNLTTIRRNIDAFIDFGVQADYFTPPSTVSFDYRSNLPWKNLHAPISLPSMYLSSRRVFRSLTISELGFIVGLPRNLHACLKISMFKHLFPVQILSSIFLPILRTCPRLPRRSINPLTDEVILSPKGSFLPAVQKWLPSPWFGDLVVRKGAVQHDDASIPYQYWDGRISSVFTQVNHTVCNVLRKFMDIIYQKSIFKDHIIMNNRGVYCDMSQRFDIPVPRLLSTVRLILHHYINSSVLSWDTGSQLLFWRWNTKFQSLALLGIPPYVTSSLPTCIRKARCPKEAVYQKKLEKITKYMQRGYFDIAHPGTVQNLIDQFGVEKAGNDIRVVFNGTSCGLTDSLCPPNFWLPTSKTLSRCTGFNYKFVDVDLGEMFLNFPLHHSLRPFSGVDLSHYKLDLIKAGVVPNSYRRCKTLYATWNRVWMGLKTSPEHAVCFYYLAKEFARGWEMKIIILRYQACLSGIRD